MISAKFRSSVTRSVSEETSCRDDVTLLADASGWGPDAELKNLTLPLKTRSSLKK